MIKWLATLFCIFSFLILLRVLLLNNYPDFSVYYESSKVIYKGQNPYLIKNLFAPFNYPPFVLLFFYPFALLPITISQYIWIGLSIIFLLISLYLLFSLYKQKLFSIASLILSALVFLSFPTKFTLGMGQVNLLILILIALFLYFLHKKRNYLAGFLLGISIMIKLFPILLLPYLLLIKRWRIVIVLLITISVLILFTFIIIPYNINQYFLSDILPSLFAPWSGVYYNQALSGFLARIISDNQLIEILKIVISLLLLIISSLIIIIRKKRNPTIINIEIGLLITISLLINNYSWQHHFVWLVIPFFTLFFYIEKKKLKFVYWIILFISYFLVSANIKEPFKLNSLIQSHVFLGTFLLWILLIHLLSKSKNL